MSLPKIHPGYFILDDLDGQKSERIYGDWRKISTQSLDAEFEGKTRECWKELRRCYYKLGPMIDFYAGRGGLRYFISPALHGQQAFEEITRTLYQRGVRYSVDN